jgi:hypothetical protein
MTDSSIETFTEALRSPFPVVYLDFRSVDRFLYRIRDLDRLHEFIPQELIDRLDQCHLYMICKRPRLSLIPNSITWNSDVISLKVSCAINGITHEGDAQILRPIELREVKLFGASPFPHRELLAFDQDGNVIQQMLLANIAHLIETLPAFAKQLEVLYVGKGLSKNTQDRLKNHETLQKVLAEINSDAPDSEVFALVFRFDYRRSAGGIVAPRTDVAESLRKNTKPYKPTVDDQVSLIEAATISYFHTNKYNSHYINFPGTDTDAAKRARESGADYIVVQIDTENIGGIPIFSQRVGPQATHYVVKHIAG